MKSKALALIKNVVRFLKFLLRILIGVTHALTGKCHKKNCECENVEETEEK